MMSDTFRWRQPSHGRGQPHSDDQRAHETDTEKSGGQQRTLNGDQRGQRAQALVEHEWNDRARDQPGQPAEQTP
jgi:hypothetical protein